MLSIVWDNAEHKCVIPDFVFHTADRRREEAIMIQEINTLRFAADGWCLLRNFRDTANAFLSISQEAVTNALMNTGLKQDAYDMLEDHVLRNAFTIFSENDCRSHRALCGVFPGSSVGNTLFGLGAWPAQAEWRKSRADAGINVIAFIHPITEILTDTSVTIFADDAGSTIAASSAEQLHWLDGVDDRLFNEAHAKIGLKQNPDKAVRTLKLQGPGSYTISRAIRMTEGKLGRMQLAPCARYLGPLLVPSANFSLECGKRIQTVNANWGKWRHFWSSRASLWVKKLVFHAIIFQALSSAISAFVLEPNHYCKLTTTFVKKARSLLRGAACFKEGTKHKALTNTQVLELLGYAPLTVEFAIIRLKFWASISRYPGNHALIIAAMFGRMPAKPCLEVHPHLQQFRADVEYLVYVEDLAEYIDEIKLTPVVILTDPHINEQFIKANFSAIRIAFLSTCVAPPACLVPHLPRDALAGVPCGVRVVAPLGAPCARAGSLLEASRVHVPGAPLEVPSDAPRVDLAVPVVTAGFNIFSRDVWPDSWPKFGVMYKAWLSHVRHSLHPFFPRRADQDPAPNYEINEMEKKPTGQ
jgi:hypothetical protein